MNRVNCFCAFCKTPRRVYRKRHLSLVNYIQALSLAGFFSFLFWQSLDAKALVLFFISLMIIEAGILLRRRMDIPCSNCGFDASLYIKDQAAACEKVKQYLVERQLDPNVWLGLRSPVTVSKKANVKGGKSTREIVA